MVAGAAAEAAAAQACALAWLELLPALLAAAAELAPDGLLPAFFVQVLRASGVSSHALDASARVMLRSQIARHVPSGAVVAYVMVAVSAS